MVRGSDLERLPQSLLHEILTKLDVESLSSTAPVCKTLHFSASQALSSLSTIDFSGFSPDTWILNHVLHENKVLKSLTLDCSRLDSSSISIFTKDHLQEVVLLKCSLPCTSVFASIGEHCPNIRVFTLEMVSRAVLEPSHICKEKLAQMLKGCSHVEFRGADCDPGVFESIELFLPKTIKTLQLRPMSEQHAKQLIHETRVFRNSVPSSVDFSIPFSMGPISFKLQSLSLVLDGITDELLISITRNLSLLVKLDLEDKPRLEPLLHHDLTNSGIQSLGSCSHLTDLSLIRSREFFPATFRRVNDMGMFLLAEGCKSLEEIRLGGFSRATDAGFVSILHSCKSLKKFEIINAHFLSDLAFHDLADTSCSLVNVRLASCSLLTSEAVENLSSCKRLEVLDLWACKSVADRGLSSISSLNRLTTLNLGGADVTDSGISVLGRGNVPIVSLCLRGCKRVTDRGVAFLLHGGGIISKTLAVLDIGYMPGISDRAVFTIAEAGMEITDLCIRHCFYVTNASIAALGLERGYGEGRKPLRRLDLCHCSGLSVNLFGSLKRPSFRGLRWLGIGSTCLLNEGDAGLLEISSERPELRLCLNGCEMGCYDGCIS
ncbi:F-box protein At-B isoform X2 [Magnolia sinica]|uniref:F-box protein At-B isoform X2 n=1 Tax=Magnolia sinica TaxID=86752 RepID=UPI00265AC18D|nr:F-box protein At-B isoform X2 [Magnolia sinica]